MTINLTIPDIKELKPRITVFGVGGAGGNAVNNMINSGLMGVEFVVANTDAQALALSKAERIVQLGVGVTEGLGAGSHPEVGRAAAEESFDEINDHLSGSHMVFITAGMGGGTGTGAAPVVARAAREQGILTVGVVTKPFQFEGNRRMRLADEGIDELHRHVDTLIVIPNQNLFRVANEKTTFADAFAMADEVLYSGVACITDLMTKDGLINLDFADVRAVMRGMGKAMMGTGEASGEDRARHAAEAAIANPLLDDISMQGARGLLISITGGSDLTLYEVDEAASRIRQEVDSDANIILGATFDDTLDGVIRVSVVATGTEAMMVQAVEPMEKVTAKAAPEKPVAEEAPARPSLKSSAFDAEVEAAISQAIEATGLDMSQVDRQQSDDVTVEPFTPKGTSEMSLEETPSREERPMPKAHVPQRAERPDAQRRMPRAEDFPPIAREGMAQQAAPAEPRNARALFKRLASNVGLNIEADAPQQEARKEPAADAPVADSHPADDAAAREAIEQGYPRTSANAANRGAQGDLDLHGRASVQHPTKEHLEIPAFLRKHG